MTKLRPIIKDRLYVPWKSIPDRGKLVNFEVQSYNENTCRECDRRDERPSDACIDCHANGGGVAAWKKYAKDGVVYAGVMAPSPKIALKKLGLDPKTKVIDNRCKTPFRSKLKYTGKLYTGKEVIHGVQTTNQVRLVEEWMRYADHGGGMIKASPRSGKTYIATNISCRLKLRTAILASQIDWLVQFCEAFAESTNLNEIATHKKSPVVLVSTRKPVAEKFRKEGIRVQMVSSWAKVPDDADVVLSTYQSLIHKPKRVKKYLASKFGFIVVDEVHQSPAAAFSRVLSKVAPYARLGLSATMDRVDHLTPIIPMLMGKVRSVSDREAIVPHIELKETGLRFPPFHAWHRLETAFSTSPKRNKQIVQQVFEDLRLDDRHCILLPVRRVKQAKLLVDAINKQAEIYNRKGEDWPGRLAELWYGKSDRMKMMKLAKSAERRVIVAIEKIVKHGLSVGPWSIVYIGLVPTSNGPMSYQLIRRVGTPHPNKPDTIVRWWLDDNSASLGCFRSLWFSPIDGILDGLKNKPRPRRYRMDDETFKRAMEIARFPRQYAPPNGGEKGVTKKDMKPPRAKSGTVRGFF